MEKSHRLKRQGKNQEQTRLFAHIHKLQLELDKLANNRPFFSSLFSQKPATQAAQLSERLNNIQSVLALYELTKHVVHNRYDSQIKSLFKHAFVDYELGQNHIKDKATRINNRRIEAVSRHQIPPAGAFANIGILIQNQKTQTELYEQTYCSLQTRYDQLLLNNSRPAPQVENFQAVMP